MSKKPDKPVKLVKPAYAIYLGIDPGKNGGMACATYIGSQYRITTTKIPAEDSVVLDTLMNLSHGGLQWPCFVVLERVGGYIRGKRLPGSLMFNFGAGFGRLCMALTALDLRYTMVQPSAWQKALGIPKRTPKETTSQWKGRLKAVAQELFPKQIVTLKNADALLIMEYCRRLHRHGTIPQKVPRTVRKKRTRKGKK